MNGNGPETLQQAIKHFENFEKCWKFMIDLRWPDKIVRCPRCGSDKVSWLEKARVWKCYSKHESPKFSLKTGTIFEDSPISLDKWLPIVWMIVNCRNGISSWEIHRAFGVTQKTAWFMLHRVRLSMQDPNDGGKIGGDVEVDETFIGGKSRNMHKARRKKVITGRGGDNGNKTIVMGILKRGDVGKKVRTKIVPDRNKKTLEPHIHESVEAGANVYTDALLAYYDLKKDYIHGIVDHAEAYVNGNVHTNGLENFWSLLKRGLNGTYVSVEPFHLFRYLDEQAFHFNNRKDTDGEPISDRERFQLALKQIVGRRLTYKELTGMEGLERPEAFVSSKHSANGEVNANPRSWK